MSPTSLTIPLTISHFAPRPLRRLRGQSMPKCPPLSVIVFSPPAVSVLIGEASCIATLSHGPLRLLAFECISYPLSVAMAMVAGVNSVPLSSFTWQEFPSVCLLIWKLDTCPLRLFHVIGSRQAAVPFPFHALVPHSVRTTTPHHTAQQHSPIHSPFRVMPRHG